MTDIVLRQYQQLDKETQIRYRDMGDGTFALVRAVYVEDGLVHTIIDSGHIIVDSGLIHIEDGDGTVWSEPLKDEVTSAAAIIPYEHHEIHEGSSFHCWYEQTVSDVGDETILAFLTANTAKRVHVFPGFHTSVAAEARLMEAPAITDNTGAPLVVFNRYRGHATESGVIDRSQNPDVANQATYFTEATQGNVTGGTEISHWRLQIDQGNKPAGGDDRAENEWVLLPNTLYAFVIESLSAEANDCTIRLNWYEKEPEG